jgi:hypothetical protein
VGIGQVVGHGTSSVPDGSEGLARATESVAKPGALDMVTRGLSRASAMALDNSAEDYCLRLVMTLVHFMFLRERQKIRQRKNTPVPKRRVI